jgi:hypothetical protein
VFPLRHSHREGDNLIGNWRSLRGDQAARPISTGKLECVTTLPHPAYQPCSLQGVFRGFTSRDILSWEWLPAYMLSAVIHAELGYPAMPLARQPEHQRFVHSGPLVLGTTSLKYPTPTTDRDQTVSRRFKPNSRTALMGEQTNPWDLLQPQDAISRHRGAKPRRRYGLLGVISLLSPAYLLSDERWPFHTEPPDH